MQRVCCLTMSCIFALSIIFTLLSTPQLSYAECEDIYQRIITFTDNHVDNPGWPSPLEYDPGNPTTIDRGATVYISVNDGVSPYIWELSGGTGFSMQATAQANVIELSASSSACGVAVLTADRWSVRPVIGLWWNSPIPTPGMTTG